MGSISLLTREKCLKSDRYAINKRGTIFRSGCATGSMGKSNKKVAVSGKKRTYRHNTALFSLFHQADFSNSNNFFNVASSTPYSFSALSYFANSNFWISSATSIWSSNSFAFLCDSFTAFLDHILPHSALIAATNSSLILFPIWRQTSWLHRWAISTRETWSSKP